MDGIDFLEILREYKNKSEYKTNIKKIGIFGSVAKDGFSESSDIDVFVVLNNIKMFDLIGIKQDLEEITNRKVDIVLLRNPMNQFLMKRINSEGIYA